MKKLYEKSELTFALVWIVIYCVLQPIGNLLSQKIGLEYSANAILCVLQAIILFSFIQKNNYLKRYGLCKSSLPARYFLYYVPLIILATGNLWFGIAINDSIAIIIYRIIFMLYVGFIEEIIFRGFLFKAMEKKNVKSAIIVSSLTFGIGHLLNLFTGMNLINNLCQIIFAIAVGFLFVTIFYRSGTLLPCIIAHSTINILDSFANVSEITIERQIAYCLILTLITIIYTLFLTKTLPQKQI